MSQVFEFNGVSLEMPVTDADFWDRYSRAFEKMGAAEQALKSKPNIGNNAVFIREYCKLFFDLYDDIFGKGTAEKMFGDKHDVALVNESYKVFLECASSFGKEFLESTNTWKYGVNRSQRRKNKYRHKR